MSSSTSSSPARRSQRRRPKLLTHRRELEKLVERRQSFEQKRHRPRLARHASSSSAEDDDELLPDDDAIGTKVTAAHASPSSASSPSLSPKRRSQPLSSAGTPSARRISQALWETSPAGRGKTTAFVPMFNRYNRDPDDNQDDSDLSDFIVDEDENDGEEEDDRTAVADDEDGHVSNASNSDSEGSRFGISVTEQKRPQSQNGSHSKRPRLKRRKLDSDSSSNASSEEEQEEEIVPRSRRLRAHRSGIFEDDDDELQTTASSQPPAAQPASSQSTSQRDLRSQEPAKAKQSLMSRLTRQGRDIALKMAGSSDEDEAELENIAAEGSGFNHSPQRQSTQKRFDDDDDNDSEDAFVVADHDATEETESGFFCRVCGSKARGEYRGRLIRCQHPLCGFLQHAACYGIQPGDPRPTPFLCTTCSAQRDKVMADGMTTAFPQAHADNAGSDARATSYEQDTGDRARGEQLFSACLRGDVAAVRDILRNSDQPSRVANAINVQCRTQIPLMAAAQAKCHDCLVELLKHKANVSYFDLDNMSALHHAAKAGSLECCKLLIERLPPNKIKSPSAGGMNVLHHSVESGNVLCVEYLLEVSDRHGLDLDKAVNSEEHTPVCRALLRGDAACATPLLSRQHQPALFRDVNGATLVHLAAEGGCMECLRLVLSMPGMKRLLGRQDDHGHPPLFSAVAAGRRDAAEYLLERGHPLFFRDPEGTTALHLAALEGHTSCVELLLNRGHKPDVKDNRGWPPLMYADFKAKEDCVLALMRACPGQLIHLSYLLYHADHDGNEPAQGERVRERVASVITSLATHDAYYKQIDAFIRANQTLLDGALGFCLKIKGLVSFDLKHAWLKRHIRQSQQDLEQDHSRHDWHTIRLEVDREHVLQSLSSSLSRCGADDAELMTLPLNVVFLGEAGTCLGPVREMFSLVGSAACKDDSDLFQLMEHGREAMPTFVCSSDLTPGAESTLKQPDRRQLFVTLGTLLGLAIVHRQHVDFPIARPFMDLVLNESFEPSFEHDLQSVDPTLYQSLKWVLENDVDEAGLEFEFNRTARKMDDSMCNVPISAEHDKSEVVTNDNKASYVQAMTRHALKTSVACEASWMREGLLSVLPKHLLSPFSGAELLLLVGGEDTISVDDWRAHTRYRSGYSSSNRVVQYFWRLVASLAPHEKRLLLQFATGYTRLPPGGFANLQSLSGDTGFVLAQGDAAQLHRLPTASTCFNTLVLPPYQTETELRNKVLVAIRNGSQGFAFS